MAFVVEDGTGLTTATSLCSVAVADTYWTDHGGHAGWTAATTANKQAALVKASDYLRNQSRYRWLGSKKTYAQTMPWPRTGVVERYGAAISDTVVPWQIVEAVAYLAARMLTEELQPDIPRGGQILSETVDVISVSYSDKASIWPVIPIVDGLVSGLLREDADPVAPYLSSPEIPESFQDNAFDNTR